MPRRAQYACRAGWGTPESTLAEIGTAPPPTLAVHVPVNEPGISRALARGECQVVYPDVRSSTLSRSSRLRIAIPPQVAAGPLGEGVSAILTDMNEECIMTRHRRSEDHRRESPAFGRVSTISYEQRWNYEQR